MVNTSPAPVYQTYIKFIVDKLNAKIQQLNNELATRQRKFPDLVIITPYGYTPEGDFVCDRDSCNNAFLDAIDSLPDWGVIYLGAQTYFLTEPLELPVDKNIIIVSWSLMATIAPNTDAWTGDPYLFIVRAERHEWIPPPRIESNGIVRKLGIPNLISKLVYSNVVAPRQVTYVPRYLLLFDVYVQNTNYFIASNGGGVIGFHAFIETPIKPIGTYEANPSFLLFDSWAYSVESYGTAYIIGSMIDTLLISGGSGEIVGNNLGGLVINSDISGIDYLLVSNNMFPRGNAGISVSGNVQDVYIDGNTIYAASGDGVFVDTDDSTTTHEVYITRNTVAKSSGYGIHLGALTANKLVVKNVLIKNSSGNIYDESRNNIVEDNYEVT